MGQTNRGAKLINDYAFRGVALPTNYYIILFTAASAPTKDTNTVSELTQIAAGNGYTAGGFQLSKNTTDFDTNTEDDTNDWALLQIKDVTWTAAGGTIPASGSGARYVGLTTDEATVADRQIIFWWDLGADRSVASGQPFTLQDLAMRHKPV